MKMPAHLENLGRSNLARRFGVAQVEDDPAPRLERAREALASVTQNVTLNPPVTLIPDAPVTLNRGRPPSGKPMKTAAERQRARRAKQKAAKP